MMPNILLSVFSGLLLVLAFPKFNYYWLVWIALLPLFYALNGTKNLRPAIWNGCFFAAAFFAIHLSWLFTLGRFVGNWIILGWACLVLFQSIFLVIFVWLAFWLLKLKTRLFPLLAALLWVMLEWLRAWGPFGVTGGDLGYSQAALLPLIQIAAWFSVYGVTFLIVFFNAALFAWLRNRRQWYWLLFSILLILASYGLGSQLLAKPVPKDIKTIKIALLQTNVDQKDRMNPAKIQEILALHEKMSWQAALEKPKVIVWPETALFTYAINDPAIFKRLQNLAVQTKTWLVLGTPFAEGDKTYNSLVAIAPWGEVVSRYDKRHLVPFGEYLPFRQLLFPMLKSIGYYNGEFNSNQMPKALEFAQLHWAAAICFESVFPGEIKECVKPDTDFILLVTNDAWFADSSALYFHLNAGIFRAIENRRYFIQAGNTGLTAVIDPYGRIAAKLPPHQRQLLVFDLPLR